MKYSKTYKLFSTFLAILMILLSFPCMAIEINNEEPQGEIFQEPDPVSENSEVYIIQEDTTKRGEFEKHYICSDGTYVVASYAEAIHYKDDHGEWVDVDNRPVQTTAGDYTTRNGDFGISVPSSTGDGHLMRMDKGEHSLSWTLSANKKAGSIKMDSDVSTMAQKPVQSQKMQVSTTKRPEIIISNSEQPHENHKVLRDEATFDLPNVSSKVRYDDLFGTGEGISVVYTTYRNKIEEDIYIEKPTDITSFSMEVAAPELTARLNSDNSVDFRDNDGKVCYHVGIPYMMDADFAVLNDIETTVSRSDDTWVITYTPDVAWFTSEERSYPILLDPSITTNDYVSNIEDTYVEENSTTNHIDEQYLYITANGNNKRNAVVRITKLPVIDEAMPIISAKLTLTAQYAPFSDVTLKASYYDSGLELDEYDYSLTTGDFFTYTAYSYLSVGLTTVTFDVSSHIYEMYDDEEFDKEYGYDYHGDFIIGYATSGDTTFTYPFFSSDYATPSSRPVFTVKYGYTLPAGILDGEVYSFQNCGSYSYMTVNGAEPANNSNVYQVWNDNDIATTTQKFKLEYVSSTGGYLLRAMSSSSGNNKVIDIQRSGGSIYSGRNVQIYSATDPISQEWLIVPVDYDVFRIVPRANMSLALTAYGYDDGTNSGKTSTSPGNIFVQTLVNNNSFQQWYIYDDDDNVISTQQFRSTIETGNYYLSNNYIGKYLHKTSNVANCMRGTISSLGDETVKWRVVNLGDGYCTIQRSDLPGYYLAPVSISNGSSVKIYHSTSETIPDLYKWSITLVTGGGCLIQNKASGYYLYALNQSANPSSVAVYPLYSSGSDNYKRQIWRFAKEENYHELGHATSFNDMAIDIGEVKSATIDKHPDHATWASYTDFDYTITSGAGYVTYDSTTHKFTSQNVGTASVTAVHKTTGLTDSFNIKVNNNAIIIVPGCMGTELIAGIDNNDYPYATDLWSTSLLDGSLSNLEIASRIISLRCNANGESVNDVVPYNNKYGAGDTYKSLYIYLEQEYGSEYTIEFFAYDWRLSNAISAASLNTFINSKNYDKVVLVCHSMGGLVASGYLSLGASQRNKVETVITLGSPLLGTSVITYLWGSEDFDVTGLLDEIGLENWQKNLLEFVTLYYDVFDMFLGNFKSLYELFPSEKYFDNAYAGKSYLVTSILGASELEITTYSETQERLENYLAFYKSNHIASAENFHASLYSGSSHVTELVNTYYIAGYNVSTIDKIECNMWDWSVYSNTTQGDSLVAAWSATLGDRAANRTFFAKDITHMGLVSNGEVKRFIKGLIEGNTSVSAYTNIHTNMQ